jgi:hypothetical protein
MSDSFWVKIKLPKEMPKMPKLPKMPKVEVRLSPSCRLYEPEAGGSIILK